MVTETRICIECGQEFETNISKKKYCSKKCSNKRYNSNRGDRYYEYKPPAVIVNKAKASCKALGSLNDKARELGMSYGQYVAMLEMEKTKHEYKSGGST